MRTSPFDPDNGWPMRSPASSTSTVQPRRESDHAAESPKSPAPTTTQRRPDGTNEILETPTADAGAMRRRSTTLGRGDDREARVDPGAAGRFDGRGPRVALVALVAPVAAFGVRQPRPRDVAGT